MAHHPTVTRFHRTIAAGCLCAPDTFACRSSSHCRFRLRLRPDCIIHLLPLSNSLWLSCLVLRTIVVLFMPFRPTLFFYMLQNVCALPKCLASTSTQFHHDLYCRRLFLSLTIIHSKLRVLKCRIRCVLVQFEKINIYYVAYKTVKGISFK